MTPKEISGRVIALNAIYGQRGANIDEAQVLAWHHVLADVSPDGWDMFVTWHKRQPDGRKFPPAPIDVETWQQQTAPKQRAFRSRHREIDVRPMSAKDAVKHITKIRDSLA